MFSHINTVWYPWGVTANQMGAPTVGARICKDGPTEGNCGQYCQSDSIYRLADWVQLLPIDGRHEILRPHIIDASAYEHGAASVRKWWYILWEYLLSEREYSKIGRQSATAANQRTLLDFSFDLMTWWRQVRKGREEEHPVHQDHLYQLIV